MVGGATSISNLGHASPSSGTKRNADEILPQFQDFAEGDDVPDPGAFTWALYPLDTGRCRSISRTQPLSYIFQRFGVLSQGDCRIAVVGNT